MNDPRATVNRSHPLRVLVVEDFEPDAVLVVRELERAGYAVEWRRVDDESSLRSALPAGPWDVLLCDYSLPGFDGLAALRVVHEAGLDVPFILISGTVGEDVAVDAMKAGAHDYIVKGHLGRLVPAVERELREARVRRERRVAEAALRESEERYRLIYDKSMDAILLTRPDGTILSANQAACRIFGRSEEELKRLGRSAIADQSDPTVPSASTLSSTPVAASIAQSTAVSVTTKSAIFPV